MPVKTNTNTNLNLMHDKLPSFAQFHETWN